MKALKNTVFRTGLIVFLAIFTTSNASAFFESKEERSVKKALSTWLSTVETQDPKKVNALYKEDAILLPTIKNKVHKNSKDRIEYFEVFLALPELSGKVNEENVQLFGDVAVNSGIYTFTYKDKDTGKKVSVPARYNFVFVKEGDNWKIANHHSSKLPEVK